MNPLSRRGLLRAGLAGLTMAPFLTPALSARAQSGPDPVTIIAAFYGVLADIMQRGPELGFDGRYKVVEPALLETFDILTMCKIAVGPDWTPMSGADKDALLDAFNTYMVSTYAARFKEVNGLQFTVGEAKPVGENRVLVATQIVKAGGDPVDLNYLFRMNEGTWRVIDIYLSGTISEMARMRSDFAQSLQAGGAQGLVAELQRKTAELRTDN
jgi:phospholipid transport system substrate-binding protein